MDKSYLEYPKRQYGQDHDFYDWRMAKDRLKLKCDGDAKVAICFMVPLEFFPLNPSGVPFKHPGAMVTPYPDLRHFTVRDYGNRVGVFRILEALEAAGTKATFAINVEVAKRYPPLLDIIQSHGHELIAHGLSTDYIHHEGLSVVEEKSLLSQAKLNLPPKGRLLSDIPRERMTKLHGENNFIPKKGDIGILDHSYTGKDGKPMSTIYCLSEDIGTEWQVEIYDTEIEPIVDKLGWMSPARNQSSRTLELLSESGYRFCLDWELDQVPVNAKTGKGEITLIPNNYELSDFTLLHTRKQTEDAWLSQIKNSIDLLLEEHARFGSQMLGLTLTPYVIGQPFRIWALRELLVHIKDTDGVEVFTAGAIDKQFRAQT